MTWFQAAVLGVVQGITEFLPISSSGHLILVPKLLGWQVNSFAFDVAIHIATLLAIFVGMRKEIIALTKTFFTHNRDHIFWKIIAATLPVVLAGLLMSDDILTMLRTTTVVGVTMIVWGAILWGADAASAQQKVLVKRVEGMHWWQALLVGVVQVFALIPGSSRSGVTMSAGLFAGLDRTTAAKFSFLLAIPAIAGAGIFAMMDVAEKGLDVPFSSMVVGFIFAFLSGTLAIRWLLALLTRISYRGFAIYRIVLGLLLLTLFR